MKRDTGLFIKDILENISYIKFFSKGLTRDKFLEDKLRQNAVIRSLEIIGEAVKNIPGSFREKYPAIPWKKIAGMRDIITHGYFRVDLDAVWNIIKKDLSRLEKQIRKIKIIR
jgi:uncharacterized protein with HEPN domain